MIVAYVTFGILQSTGTIKDEKIQLTGAAAGFIVIFLVSSNFYKSQMEKIIGFSVGLAFEGKSTKDMNFEKSEENGNWWVYSDDPANTKPVDEGKLRLSFAPPGTWIWKLPSSFKQDHSIKMKIIDDDNQTWSVNERPYITLTARKKGGE